MDVAGASFGLSQNVRDALHHVFETIIRLPGLLLLELWLRKFDVNIKEITEEMIQNTPLSTYLDMSRILEFVHTRNFDQSAATILSYSVLLLCAMFLMLPLGKLVQVYLHSLSLLLFGFAHYMSIRYVQLEQTSDPELKLDDFVKLERHGFHFLAQLMLSVAQSVILRMESDVGRVFLAVFTIPIIARMCGFPVTKLIIAHNVACSAAMLLICIYVLNRVPALLLSIRRAYRQLRAILIVRGIAIGAVTVWRRLRIAELLTSAYLTMFCVRMYVEVSENQRRFNEIFSIMMSAIAECTSTPLSLLALALTVSCACKLVVKAAQWTVGGVHDERHVLAHGGCTEALTLVLLCFQIGILGMRIEQKVFLLGLVLFIVMSALLQSLYEIMEPQMLALGAMPGAPRSRHMRTVTLAGILILGPIALSGSIASFLPIDLWCVIIVSNCILTAIRSVSTTIVYSLTLIDNRAAEPWERYDDFVFYARITTRCVELLLALGVVAYGVVAALNKQWTVASIVVLIFHTYFNVWRRVHSAASMIKARHTATRNIDSLDKATKSQLEQRKDVCPICFMDLIEEARITPCRHLFHGACLRKWLSVKNVCPLCYQSLVIEKRKRSALEHCPERRNTGNSENQDGDQRGVDLEAPLLEHHRNRRRNTDEASFSSEWDTSFRMALCRRLWSSATSQPSKAWLSSASVHSGPTKTEVLKTPDTVEEKLKKLRHIPEFPLIYPDFLQSPVWGRRNALRERLERADMLERRMQLDIPEFYVGSIVAVTTSDSNLANRQNRFLGICIRREREGLQHQFTLRNVVDGLGVEVMYELYNPTILKIETIKLERRLDDDLSYLIDALPEYSTFDFNLEPIAHPAGTPVPVNAQKIKLRPPPWTRRWELYDYKGIEDSWTQATPYYKRRLHKTRVNDYRKYDLIADYRLKSNELEHELAVEKEMARFEAERHQSGATRRRILRAATKITHNLNLSNRSLRKRTRSTSVSTTSMETVGDICRLVLESRSGLGAELPVGIPDSIIQQAEHVLFHGLPVSVHTILAHEKCRDEGRPECPNAIQVEVWTIQVDYVRDDKQKLQPLFLKQAVRSHLHFSQLNSWVANNNSKLPKGMLCSYRLSLSDHLKNEELLSVDSHHFPQCLIDRHHQLTVKVKWVKRDRVPTLPPQCVFEKVPFEDWEQPLSPNDCSPPNTPHFFISPDDESPCHREKNSPNPPPPKRVHRASLETSESSVDTTFDGVSPMSSAVDGREGRTPEEVISQSTEVEVLADFLASSSSIGAAKICPPLDSGNDATPRRPRSLNLRQRRNTTGSVERNVSDPSLHQRTHGHSALDQPHATFNRRTGLPLSSSPAPMKRNERSFDADIRLERLRRGSQFVDDSSGSDGEGAPVAQLARSPTSGTGLLCNFEESVLNGRLEPLASIVGFRLELAANGSFTSPHMNLPVTTFFFNISDDATPSPYLGHCSLEEIGRKGYHISKKGTVQATLFNPQGTVVKIFVVKIDLADMPPSSQTFIRQRSFFMPVGCRLEDVQRSWLKYLIHLRLATDRAGRLFIHTDIRILFSNKSDLDSLNLEKGLGESTAVDSGKFQLTTFTEMPQRPKYSPVK